MREELPNSSQKRDDIKADERSLFEDHYLSGEELERLVPRQVPRTTIIWTGLREPIISYLGNEFDKLKEVFLRLGIDPDTRQSLTEQRG